MAGHGSFVLETDAEGQENIDGSQETGSVDDKIAFDLETGLDCWVAVEGSGFFHTRVSDLNAMRATAAEASRSAGRLIEKNPCSLSLFPSID